MPTDIYLTKRLGKMIGRIERIMVPTNEMVHNNMDIGRGLDVFLKLITRGDYYRDADSTLAQVSKTRTKIVSKGSASSNSDAETFTRKVVMWDKLKADLIEVLSCKDPNFVVPPKVQLEIDSEYELHVEEETKLMAKEKLRNLQLRNGLPVIPGKWRKEAYPPRVYHPLDDYMITKAIPESEAVEQRDLLNTPLNGFLGQAYNYDDHGLTEEWMVTFKDEGAEATADDVIRTQLESLMEIMLVQVQDRVCTQDGVLDKEPLVLGKHIKEAPVWGMDCYTRRMVELTIGDRVEQKELVTEKAVQTFIEKKLLPAINAQPADKAHNMKNAVQAIIEVRHVTVYAYDCRHLD
jgi:hypothetical protein